MANNRESENSQESTRLQFGVMTSGEQLTVWQKECIREVLDIRGVELSLVIKDGRSTGWRKKLNRVRPRQFLFQVSNQFFFSHEMGKSVSTDEVFEEAEVIKVDSIKEEGYSEYFPEDKIQKIEEYGLDFILRFGFGIIRGNILEVAKYGIWSFHHDDEREYRGGPPCFWEVYHEDDQTGFILQRLTDRLDGGVILKRGSVPTVQTSYSANMNRVYRASTSLPAEVCREILSSDGLSLEGESSSNAPIYSYPTNGQFMLFIAKIIWRRIKSSM